MLIKDIFMELRSRLRSCNVYITTGVDFTKSCNFKINIQANCIILNYYCMNESDNMKRKDSFSSIESLSDCYSEDDSDVTLTIPINSFCHIIPNSMSCLKVDKNNISFRILTESKNGGNFYKELLSTNTIENTKTGNDLQINISVDEELKICCSNCSNIVSENVVKFDRMLELPSANLDMADWFCHAHGSTSQNELKPNKNDFLHRLTYFVLDSKILSEKTNKFNLKREVYHCNRCLAWLGIKSKGTVKLFNSEIKFVHNGIQKIAFQHKTPVEDIYVDDFIYTIEQITKEFNLGLQYTLMCKIVLECLISATDRQYLLVWIIDKDLQVLKNKDHIVDDKIELQSSVLMKILYKIEFSLNEQVETWLTDPGAVSTQISKRMFSNGLEHLQKMSLKVPEAFRETNGYFVSYLKV